MCIVLSYCRCKMLHDGCNTFLRDFFSLIQSTNPRMVFVTEQESEHNRKSLNSRLSGSSYYHFANFDSFSISLPLDSLVRIKIKNIVACEDCDRLERHKSFGMWIKSTEQGGFRCISLVLWRNILVVNFKWRSKSMWWLSLCAYSKLVRLAFLHNFSLVTWWCWR